MPISRHKALMHDVYLAIGALFLAGMLFYGAMGLPAPRFEPMGSAALPPNTWRIDRFSGIAAVAQCVAQTSGCGRNCL